ncbi:Pkinase-domain-containing protein [Ramaria rubella]|nr:Pkinase-domain-containing protein [Ramaria rubella]
MDLSASLQIPDNDWSQPGPSSSRSTRHASAAVGNPMSQPSSKKRASHSVTTSHNQHQEESPAYRDVYSHPAAVAFATTHPRRTIPKFGPYLLLQTLGEGEFGKVKLGLHGQWGEEVAVKLIRRGNVDNPLRMSKVEREIEVLRTIKHPNIVRLYDVIETDKYIGIILEYASGGELFDHILAHRYLKEKDACKLFAQLISGVAYIHAKKIVHRDLKLENLLLDRNRNVIITDFGFANRFEHRADDLMQTSCGSPCYAAPELVISEGLYVGSAVDIWSCGVILYAMLAGYLPFDDDPANPEGDNINLLYKYIVNTPLTFPDYVSPDARDLLSMMLVPDPKRRSGLPEIMGHRWLAPYSQIFERSVADLERTALEQQDMKRQAYQRQMRSHAAEQQAQREREQIKMSRNRSDVPPPSSSRHQEYLYDSSVQDLPLVTPAPQRRAVASAIVTGSSAPTVEEDPFVASSPKAPINHPEDSDVQGTVQSSRRSKSKESSRSKRSHKDKTPVAVKSPDKDGTGSRRKKGGYRHTVQLEYDEPTQPTLQGQSQNQSPPKASQGDADMVHVSDAIAPSKTVAADALSTPRAARKPPVVPVAGTPSSSPHVNRSVAEPASPAAPEVETTTASDTLASSIEPAIEIVHTKADSGSTGSGGSRHRRGISMDKFGFGKKIGSSASEGENAPTKSSSFLGKRPSAQLGVKPQATTPDSASKEGSVKGSVKGKSRRKTLSLMVEPLSRSIKDRTNKNRSVTVDTKPKSKDQDISQEIEILDVGPVPPPFAAPEPTPAPIPAPLRHFKDATRAEPTGVSSLSAKSVMSWFRSRSISKRDAEVMPATAIPPTFDMVDTAHTPNMDTYVGAPGASSSNTVGQPPVQVIVTTPNSRALEAPTTEHKWARSPSDSGPRNGLANLMRNVTGVGATPTPVTPKRGKFDNNSLRIHQGAVDQATITSGAPPDVFAHVTKVLLSMGLEVQKEAEFKYRCIRPKKPKSAGGRDVFGRPTGEAGSGYTAFTMVGSAASNGVRTGHVELSRNTHACQVDKRGLPMPSHTAFTGTGGMLRGLLMRRQSSQVSAHGPMPMSPPGASNSFDTEPDSMLSDSSVSHAPEQLPAGTLVPETIYGDRSVDQGDEVRFSVELTRIDRLEDTLSLDIRRLKGNLRSYKYLYDMLRERCDFSR